MSKAALHIKDLNVEYILKKGSHPAVKNISFQVEQGEIFGLVGESGSGKSTVVQALIRTLPPPAVITGGEVIICLLYTSPSPRDRSLSRMPSSA